MSDLTVRLASMWRKAMIQLGLGDDADYDQQKGDGPGSTDGSVGGTGADGAAHRPQQHRPASSAVSQIPPVTPVSAYTDEPSAIGEVRPINTRGTSGARDSVPGSGQTVNPSSQGSVRARPQVVRPMPVTANARPHVVVPASFNQAQDVADKFKNNQPVVMNLQAADRELSRRLIDFASGLCYGLGGRMERLVNQVYLLSPISVEVSVDERRRLQERGYES